LREKIIFPAIVKLAFNFAERKVVVEPDPEQQKLSLQKRGLQEIARESEN
jgi:hypothetical protein